MSSNADQIEQAILESVTPGLEAEGFRVIVQPSRALLPPFMQGYAPDAIAVRPDKKLAIEVAPKARAASEKLKQLRDLIANQPDWELRIFYAPQRAELRIRGPASRQAVEKMLSTLSKILQEAGPVPALLTAWSAFEAAARLLMPRKLDGPRSPASLVEILASSGHVTPTEADKLRALVDTRNRAAHGDLDISLTFEELDTIVFSTRSLLDLSRKTRRGTRRGS